MLDDLMWRGVEDGYRRLAANDAELPGLFIAVPLTSR